MLVLSIHHSIYLTREQRYALHNQMDVDTVGVSVPVWRMKDKTSEPAREVFCKYMLRNPHKEIPIKIMTDGYLLCLPYRLSVKKRQRSMTSEEWTALSQEQREAYYTSIPKDMSSESLLDIADGGSQSLIYRESNKIKSQNQFMNIIHYVNIYDMNYLDKSMQSINNS